MSETEHSTAADGRRRLARTGFADGWRYHAARPDYPEPAVTVAYRATADERPSETAEPGRGEDDA